MLLRDGNYFDITGTTTITTIEDSANAWKVGSIAVLQFDGILTLTHNATNLILPSAANIATVAGDIAFMQKVASGDWKCVSYNRASGTALIGDGSGDALVANPLSQFAATTSAQLAGVISDETGSGLLVFNTSPTLVTPLLGTPASGILSNCTAGTTSAKGVLEISTIPEVQTGTSTVLAVTPEGVAKRTTFGWMAFGDETSDIITGTGKLQFQMPNYATTLTGISVSVTTAPTGSAAVFDLNEAGSTVLSTKVTIPISAKTSEGTPTAATGSVTLDTGASGSVDGILVNSIEIMSGAENFDSSLATTATNVASNITAHTSSPDYNASATDETITITAVTLGTGPNGFTVVTSVTTITKTDVNMANGVDAPVISDSALAANALMTVDTDTIGSTVAGIAPKMIIYFQRA